MKERADQAEGESGCDGCAENPTAELLKHGGGELGTRQVLGAADFGISHAITIHLFLFLWTPEYRVCSKFGNPPPSVLCYGHVCTCR